MARLVTEKEYKTEVSVIIVSVSEKLQATKIHALIRALITIYDNDQLYIDPVLLFPHRKPCANRTTRPMSSVSLFPVIRLTKRRSGPEKEV